MPEYQYVVIPSALKCFEDADTGSQVQGLAVAGKYKVEELRLDYPNGDTDYAHISIPALGDEESWVCIRWKQRRYGRLETTSVKPAVELDISDDDMAIDEEQLTTLLPEFYPFSYHPDRARYPYALPGFRARQAPPAQNNCCTFIEALLVKAWENAVDEFRWRYRNHAQMMIFSADDHFSPVTCLVSKGMAHAVDDPDQSPHRWTVVQGWRRQWDKGHTFIILDHHTETDRVLTLESNSTFMLNGVGYRMIGNIGDFNSPPPNWWENNRLWTWEEMKSVYRFRSQCALKVKNLRWFV